MAGKAGRYSPKQVLQSFMDVLISGYAAGTFITVTPNADSYHMIVGGDGDATRVQDPDLSLTIEFTLLQTSAANDFLMAKWLLDQTGLGHGPYMLKDLSGRTVVPLPDAWISKRPEVTFSKDGDEGRKWTIQGVNGAAMFVGGS